MTTPPPLPGASAPDEDDAPPTACVRCGSLDFSTRTQLPVCDPCRMNLVRHPFPLWVKLASAVVAVLVVVSLALSKERFHGAYHFTRAEKMNKEQRWEEAYQSYHSIIGTHFETDTVITYAEVALKSGHYDDSVLALKSMSGRYLSDQHQQRTEVVFHELERVAELQEQALTATPDQATPPLRPKP